MSTVKLMKWGNSIGIRVPAAIMKEAHLISGEELEITANAQGVLTLVPIKNSQEGWEDLFNVIADAQNEELLLDIPNDFDDAEWAW